MTLQNVVPWGRNLNEYREMFLLTPKDLNSKILGCSDGPSSFNKEVTQNKGKVISLDPVYEFTKQQLQQRILQTAKTILEQVEKTKEDFVWTAVSSVEELEAIRMAAMNDFLNDYEKGKEEKRYIQGALPALPFADKSFDLILCSHFLFLYSEHFDLQFHTDSIIEMCRAGKEVRIFPIIDLKGKRSRHLFPIIETLQAQGHTCTLQTTHYEFQRGGNEMLRIFTDSAADKKTL